MNVFVKLDQTGTNVSSVCVHPFSTNLGSSWKLIDASLVNQNESKILVRNQYGKASSATQIDYDDFVKYFYNFRRISVTDDDNVNRIVILLRQGLNFDNFKTSRLQSLDMSVPLSFTRANTIVNFGRL